MGTQLIRSENRAPLTALLAERSTRTPRRPESAVYQRCSASRLQVYLALSFVSPQLRVWGLRSAGEMCKQRADENRRRLRHVI